MDIIQAAKDGSLMRVGDALKAGVLVDTTDKVCLSDFDLNSS